MVVTKYMKKAIKKAIDYHEAKASKDADKNEYMVADEKVADAKEKPIKKDAPFNAENTARKIEKRKQRLAEATKDD